MTLLVIVAGAAMAMVVYVAYGDYLRSELDMQEQWQERQQQYADEVGGSDVLAPPPGSTSGSGPVLVPRTSEQVAYYFAEITRVIDGDTLEVDSGGILRLALVDTPERGEDGFAEAAEYVETYCAPGNRIAYVVDTWQYKDPYGRVIAKAWCSPGAVSAAESGGDPGDSINELLLALDLACRADYFVPVSEFGTEPWLERGRPC